MWLALIAPWLCSYQIFAYIFMHLDWLPSLFSIHLYFISLYIRFLYLLQGLAHTSFFPFGVPHSRTAKALLQINKAYWNLSLNENIMFCQNIYFSYIPPLLSLISVMVWNTSLASQQVLSFFALGAGRWTFIYYFPSKLMLAHLSFFTEGKGIYF